MKSGSSAPIHSFVQVERCLRHSSSSQRSRPGRHRDLVVGAAGHEHGLHHRHALDGPVHGLLEGDALAAAQALVGGHHHAAAGVHDPVAQRLRAEPAEDDGVHGADPRAGQHRVDELGHHAHVDADPVAAADAVGEEHVRHPADVVLQLPVRDVPVGPRLVLGPDDRGAVAEGLEVPVDAVEGGVEAARGEPGEVDLVVVGVEDGLPGVEPADRLRLLGPEPLGVVEGQAVEPLVLGPAAEVRPRGDVGLDGIQVGHRAPPSRSRLTG